MRYGLPNTMRLLGLIITLFSCLCFAQRAESAPMSFQTVSNGGNLPSCCWTIAEGEITSDTPKEFERFIAGEFVSELGMGEIRLNAFGTDVDAAIELGRLFRKYNATVVIGKSKEYFNPWHERTDDGHCKAVCLLAFLGGAQREVPEGNSITIGQFTSYGLVRENSGNGLTEEQNTLGSIENQILTGKVVKYIAEMGIDPRIYSLSVAIHPSVGSRPISESELEALQIENAKDTISKWRTEIERNGLVAIIDTKISRRSLSLFCSDERGHLVSISMDKAFEQDLNTVLNAGATSLILATDSQRSAAQIMDVISSDDNTITVVFAVTKEAALSIAKTSNIQASAPEVSLGRNWEAFITNNFSFFGIEGDERLPVRALKVCQT